MAIPASEIARWQQDAAELLPDTAAITRRTDARDAGGGVTTTWATVATVACRLQPQKRPGIEAILAARTTSVMVSEILFPAGTDVAVRDRIVIGSVTWEVRGVYSNEWEVYRIVDAVAIGQGL